MKNVWGALVAAVLLPVVLTSAARGEDPAPKAYVVVFDFAGADGGKFGKRLADSVRLRLRRHRQYEVIDRLTTQGAAGPLGIQTDRAKVIELMSSKVGANLGVYGTAEVRGELVRAEVCVVDITGGKPSVKTHVFSDESEQAAGVVAAKIVEAVRGKPEWKPPEYGDETEPGIKELGAPLHRGGDFEKARPGWDRPDNVSTFIEPGPAGRGKVLRIRTDLQRDPWLAYRRKLRFGEADPNRPPKIARDTSYGSVAGLEGVHFRSQWIDATPGHRYWLLADMKGKTAGIFFPKIYVKGFSDWSPHAKALPELSLKERKLTAEQFAALPPEQRKALIAADAKAHGDRYRRECFRWYLSCRNEDDTWKHYAAPLPPRGGLPKDVRWLRIDVHAYWPPGNYYFDNVNLYKDPRQKAPLDEDKPRTPGFEDKQSATAPVGVSWRVKRQIGLTRVKIAELAGRLESFRLHVGRYPTEAEGLLALVNKPAFEDESLAAKWRGPYAAGLEIEDAWGNVFAYKRVAGKKPGRMAVLVYSRGPNGRDDGGEGDDVKEAAK